MNIPNLTYKSSLLISAPKIDNDLLWNLSMLFVGLAIVYFIGVFFYRSKLSSSAKKVRDRKRELSPMISEFLFLEEDATKDEKSNYIALKIEIRQLIKDPFNRQVLSEVLLDLRKDISGEAQKSLFKLYQDLGLNNDAFAKLKSWRWQVISKGILELTQMEVEESYSFITKFINDKRSTIRKQAEIATVTLRHEGINYFLDTTKYKISEWQQLKLLDVIRNKEDFNPPRFKAWLTSNNKYVVLFALRLIKYYNQNDANTSLIELVKHKNNQIKEEAIACIKEFNVTESVETLKLVFWNSSITVKIAILDAIAHIGSFADIDFLNLIDKKELNFSVKSKALSSINAIAPETVMPSKGIQNESRYKVPDNISETAARTHAEKHADILSENEEEYSDEIVLEESVLESATDLNIKEDEPAKSELDTIESHIIPKTEKVLEDNPGATEKGKPSPKENTEDLNHIYDIEVELDMVEQAGFEEIEKEVDDLIIEHLDFLPIVIGNEVNEKETHNSSNNKYPIERVWDIEVISEELLTSEDYNSAVETFPTKEKSLFFEEFNMNELAFLPIVVDNEIDQEHMPGEELELTKIDIQDSNVVYEVVVPHTPKENKDETDLNTDLVFDFEPINKLENIDLADKKKNSPTSLEYRRYASEEIRNAQVIYEEVVHNDPDLEVNEIVVLEPYVFTPPEKTEPILNVRFKEEEEINEDKIDLTIENEEFLQKIIDDLVSFDTPSKVENTIDDSFVNLDWDIDENELDFIPVSFEKDEEETTNFIKIEKTRKDSADEKINISRAFIPKAIFGDIEFEASTRQLLNDLAEMGDKREIPFLKELLHHEKYKIFEQRITALIEAFNDEHNVEKLDTPLQPFSVFQDLFRTCDNEAKLILLNEVVEVGDEKEIRFLEDLTKDKSSEIRKRASLVLKDLRFKLFGEEGKEEPNRFPESEFDISELIEPFEYCESENPGANNHPDDMFDLNFDLTETFDVNEDEKKNDEKQYSVQYGAFFGQICSFSNKILEKLHG